MPTLLSKLGTSKMISNNNFVIYKLQISRRRGVTVEIQILYHFFTLSYSEFSFITNFVYIECSNTWFSVLIYLEGITKYHIQSRQFEVKNKS